MRSFVVKMIGSGKEFFWGLSMILAEANFKNQQEYFFIFNILKM
jgi:hypothetical protein